MNSKPALFQSFFTKYVWDVSNRSFSTLGSPATWLLDIFGSSTSSGENVSESNSFKIAAVYTSINILSESVAALPVKVYQNVGDQKKTINNKIQTLLAISPDGVMSSFSFWFTVVAQVKAWGNAYAIIERDRFFQPVKLTIVYAWEVDVVKYDNGTIKYRHKGFEYSAENVLHFRVFTLNGIIGVSPIRQNAETLGMGIKLDKYGGKIIGERPPGLLTTDQALTKEQREQNMNAWKGMTQGANQGSTPVLGGGMKYIPFTLPASDVAYIESKNFNKKEIYGIFRVPPTLAQDYERATFSNAEQQDLVFIKHTLTPLIKSFEQELNLKLFPLSNQESNSPFYVKFNLNALMRGDTNARKEYFQAMLNTGVMSPNEVRELEDMNPYEGGNRYYVQGAMVPVDRVDDQIDNNKKETATKPKVNGHNHSEHAFN